MLAGSRSRNWWLSVRVNPASRITTTAQSNTPHVDSASGLNARPFTTLTLTSKTVTWKDIWAVFLSASVTV